MAHYGSYVQTFGMSHTALSLMSYTGTARTLRLVINSAISGDKARVHLSNKFSKNPVIIEKATIAPCNKNGKIPNKQAIVPLTLQKKESFVLLPSKIETTDEAEIEIKTDSYFCVTISTRGALRSGNELDNVELLIAKGNRTDTLEIKNKKRPREKVITLAGKILGLRLPKPIPVFETVELCNHENAGAIVCFGDSLTQQGFWTKPFEEKIRQEYKGRFSVINRGIGGNRLLKNTSPFFVLTGFFGIKALSRVHTDVLRFDNVKYVISCIGINDIFQPRTIAAVKKEAVKANELIDGLKSLNELFKSRKIINIGMNYLPFGLSRDSSKDKNALRKEVNELYSKTDNLYYEMIDIDKATRQPENPDLPLPHILCKDKLHPNTLGGEIIADCIPLKLFEPEKF